MLKVTLEVKFRAFGITFGRLNREWRVELRSPVPLPPRPLVTFADRGVSLLVELI